MLFVLEWVMFIQASCINLAGVTATDTFLLFEWLSWWRVQWHCIQYKHSWGCLGEKIKSVHLHPIKKPLRGFPVLQKVKVVLCFVPSKPSMMHGPVSFMPLFFFSPIPSSYLSLWFRISKLSPCLRGVEPTKGGRIRPGARIAGASHRWRLDWRRKTE